MPTSARASPDSSPWSSNCGAGRPFIAPHKRTEAKRGRRWFLRIAARLGQSGRQKEVQISVRGWAEQLKDGYLRLHEWIRTTAPQLKTVTPIPV